MKDQDQQAGDDAIMYQAGHDLVVYEGPTLAEVRDEAMVLWRRNFEVLHEAAARTAFARAEKLLEDLFERLRREAPDALENAADPDLQRTLIAAQTEFACSGEADLEQALLDLLAERVRQDDRSLQTIVLNEAIRTVAKLTPRQRGAIAVCFFIRYTQYVGVLSLDAFYAYLRHNLLPMTQELPISSSSYQHIEYVGAGSVSVLQLELEAAIANSAPWFCTRGFAANEAHPALQNMLADSRLFSPALRDPSRQQVNARRPEDVEQLASLIGDPTLADALRFTHQVGPISHDEVRADLLEHIPELGELFKVYADSALKNLTLTSVGLAIGHGYWKRFTGGSTPLSIWVSD